MGIVKPKFVQVALKQCGFDTSNDNIPIIKDTNVVNLLYRASALIGKECIGNERLSETLFSLALKLIKETVTDDKLSTIDFMELLNDEKLKERLSYYELQ